MGLKRVPHQLFYDNRCDWLPTGKHCSTTSFNQDLQVLRMWTSRKLGKKNSTCPKNSLFGMNSWSFDRQLSKSIFENFKNLFSSHFESKSVFCCIIFSKIFKQEPLFILATETRAIPVITVSVDNGIKALAKPTRFSQHTMSLSNLTRELIQCQLLCHCAPKNQPFFSVYKLAITQKSLLFAQVCDL